MDNILDSVKRVLKNKNTVTIIGVIVILVLLYFGYSYKINSAVSPMKVPVATQDIQPRTLITSEMVEMIDVPSISVSENVLTSSGLIVGKYSNVNTMIPAGSMFYKKAVIDAADLPDIAFVDLGKDEIAYSFPVDLDSTYGNSMMPNSHVDIYMKATEGEGENEKIILGKLLSNVKVLAVKDSSGRNVFENTDEGRVPYMMIFGLKEKIWLLLGKASYLQSKGVELFPVPVSKSLDITGATEVSTERLEEFINANAVDIPIKESSSSDTTDKLIPTVKESGGSVNTVTITYPTGCGSTYVCKYKKNNEAEKTVSKKTQKVVYNGSGTLVATVTESNGTVHTLNTSVPLANSTTTDSTADASTNSTTNANAGA